MKRAFALALVLVAALALGGLRHRRGRAGPATWARSASPLPRLRPSGATPVNATGEPIAYLAYRGPSGPELGAFDLARAALVWRQPGELTGRIEVGRAAIVHAARTPAGATVLVGRSGGTGEVLWRQELPGDQRLIGYAVDGDSAYYVARAFSATGTHGPGSLTALDARTGALRWRHDLPPGDVGAPAARGGLVAVPVGDPVRAAARRRQRGRAGAHPVDRAGGQLRARAARGDLLRLERGVSRVARHGDRLAQVGGLRPGDAAGVRARDLRARHVSRPSRATTRRSTATASSGGPRPTSPRRRRRAGGRRMAFRDGLVFVHDFRFFFAHRRRQRGAALGARREEPRRRRLGPHRRRAGLRHRRRRARRARRRDRATRSTARASRARPWCAARPSTPTASAAPPPVRQAPPRGAGAPDAGRDAGGDPLGQRSPLLRRAGDLRGRASSASCRAARSPPSC